jgi:hypothetical protein
MRGGQRRAATRSRAGPRHAFRALPAPPPPPQVLLLSLAAYAGSVVLQALLRAETSAEGWQLVTAAAWMVAILLDFFVSLADSGGRAGVRW